MSAFAVEGRRVVVVGAGRSGVAAAELLVSKGAAVTVTDVRSDIEAAGRLRAAGVTLKLGAHHASTLAGADLIVLSPGVPSNIPAIEAARAAGVPVTGELEMAFRWLRGRVIAVTGTKGKSTTTTLIGRMLRAGGLRVAVGGNIGDALSAQVAESAPDMTHVIEVSSFQLETAETFHPWIAVFLNLSPDHLDRHASFEEYEAAKARIFANQDERDWSLVNADDSRALALGRQGRARLLRFSTTADLTEGIVVSGDAIVHRSAVAETRLLPVAAVRVPGRHLLSDVLAAAGTAMLAGVAADRIQAAVESFRGLEHALESVGEVGGVRFVNDSKATNVEAARRSIESFEGNLVPIVGGRFKGGDLRDLRGPLQGRAKAVVAIGESRPLVRAALEDALPVHEAESMAAAVRLAFSLARPAGIVLLAPACASFDMFRDYADRGRIFKAEVAGLAGELGGSVSSE